METQLTRQLYLDLDGVLADFDKRADLLLGMDSYKFNFVYGQDEFWKRLDADTEFFRRMDPMPDAYLLWNSVKHLYPIILTALPRTNPERVAAQKLDWVRNYLGPHVPVMTCLTKDKPLACRPGDILVDDRAVNKAAWEKAGGTYIIHKSASETLGELLKVLS